MSEEWLDAAADYLINQTRVVLKKKKFADRVQMIHKLLKLAVEALDGMEAEVARECP